MIALIIIGLLIIIFSFKVINPDFLLAEKD